MVYFLKEEVFLSGSMAMWQWQCSKYAAYQKAVFEQFHGYRRFAIFVYLIFHLHLLAAKIVQTESISNEFIHFVLLRCSLSTLKKAKIRK